MNFRMFKTLFILGYFKAPKIKTIGDLQKFIKGEWKYEIT